MKKTMLSVMLGAGLVTLSVNAAVTGKLLLEFAAMGPVDSSGHPYGTLPNPNGLNSTIYLYDCTDSTCSTSSQRATNGYITNVVPWKKSQKGPGGYAPSSWVFLDLTGNDQYYNFWQNNPSSPNIWQSCMLHVTSSGGLGSDSTCVGINTSAGASVQGAQPFWGVGALFNKATSSPAGPTNPKASNVLPTSQNVGITFENSTSNSNVCLGISGNLVSGIPNKNCTLNTGPRQNVQKIPNAANKNTYVIPNPLDGINSGVGQVYSVTPGKTHTWSSFYLTRKGVNFSTQFEYTLWPYTKNATPGTWTFDISFVNGFNVGGKLIANNDLACTISGSEGGASYLWFYPVGTVMASFPNTPQVQSAQCPKGEAVGSQGCVSLCNLTGDPAQCCPPGSDYYPASNCTAPPTSQWVENIVNNSTSVYAFSFQDYRGTFTCEAGASVTFQMVDAVLSIN